MITKYKIKYFLSLISAKKCFTGIDKKILSLIIELHPLFGGFITSCLRPPHKFACCECPCLLCIDIMQKDSMEYTKTFNELKSLFKTENKEISIPGSDIKIHNIPFQSDVPLYDFSNKNDTLISENSTFSYPVFSPARRESTKVILLLHGLNERTWVKYLVWAFYLAQYTDSYVILFPISFHINRSPSLWKDPRAMVNFMKDRNSTLEEIQMSSFANIALSNRLTEDPMRFFKSGYQTSSDIVKLLSSVRNGKHEIIPRTRQF